MVNLSPKPIKCTMVVNVVTSHHCRDIWKFPVPRFGVNISRAVVITTGKLEIAPSGVQSATQRFAADPRKWNF